MKQLSKTSHGLTTNQQKIMSIQPMKKQEETTNMILNRLIYSSDLKRKHKIM